jgi:hypothetical protein
MKTKLPWWSLAILLLIAACNKDESVETNGKPANFSSYIRCKIDGVDKTFNINASASKQDLGGGAFNYSILGKAVIDAANRESFGFTFQVLDSLKAGTYSEIDSSSTYYLAAVYNPNTNDAAKIFSTQMDSTNPFQVTVNVISDSLMSGSFKGKLLLNTMDSSATAVTVTDGDFKVKVQ